ncbi:MAG: hypothetical protein EXR72_22190 [Myxococcales bacterium]|nr:hypothetical protein [Myxococcales bacterium]
MRRAAPLVLGVLVLAAGFAGCRCEEREVEPPVPAAAGGSTASSVPLATVAADPTGPRLKGYLCPGPGQRGEAAAGAYRYGPWVVRKSVHWEDPPDDSARFINVPGVRDIRREADVAFLARRLLPDGRYAVLTAKPMEFPDAVRFDDDKGAQLAFDEVAANPNAMLFGVKRITWAGRPAIEGGVAGVYPNGTRTFVHHLILPTEAHKALVVTYLADEAEFPRFFAEACDAVTLGG